MASIRKIGKKYRAEIYVKGIRDSAYFERKAEAQNWAQSRSLELRSLDHGQSRTHTVGDALIRYRDSVSLTKKGARWESLRINSILKHEFSKVKLMSLKPSHLAQWRDDRLVQVSSSTVNREMNIISACLNLAVKEWGWLSKSPTPNVKRPKEAPPRDRRISDDEIDHVCFVLGYDEGDPVTTKKQEVAIAFLFAIETAMRLGEIVTLMKHDIKGKVAHLKETKNGFPRKVPLSSRALDLLAQLPCPGGSYFQQTSDQASALFKKYKQIPDLVFHDTRHEAITRLAKKLRILDLARMTGHRDLNQLQIYYNESADEIAELLG